MKRLAAIDVGSTSVHLLVADVSDRGLDAVLDVSMFAGLGEAVAASGLIGDALTSELAGLLAGYVRQATELGAAEVVVVATSPLRRAADAARVVRSLRAPVHVLTEREEALLALIGATGGRRPSERVAVVDVGGGSTQVVLAAADGELRVLALPIGAAGLTGRRAPADPPARADLDGLLAEAREAWASVAVAPPAGVIAVGGTADNLARLADTARLDEPTLHGLLDRLERSSANAVAVASGLRPARVRLLPAGAAILLALLERWPLAGLDVSPAGLREGVLRAVAGTGHAWRDQLPLLVRARLP